MLVHVIPQVVVTEGEQKGTKVFKKVPDMTKGTIILKDGTAVSGFRAVATKDQKVALGYMPFCPYHAHALHSEGTICTQ